MKISRLRKQIGEHWEAKKAASAAEKAAAEAAKPNEKIEAEREKNAANGAAGRYPGLDRAQILQQLGRVGTGSWRPIPD